MNNDDWITYDKENPPKNGAYLCSTDTDVFMDFMWNGKWRDSSQYNIDIVAYAELPSPYEKDNLDIGEIDITLTQEQIDLVCIALDIYFSSAEYMLSDSEYKHQRKMENNIINQIIEKTKVRIAELNAT